MAFNSSDKNGDKIEDNPVPLIGDVQSTVMTMVRSFRETIEASFEELLDDSAEPSREYRSSRDGGSPTKRSQSKHRRPVRASERSRGSQRGNRAPPSERIRGSTKYMNYDGYSDEESTICDDGSFLTHEDSEYDLWTKKSKLQSHNRRGMQTSDLPDKKLITSTGFILCRTSFTFMFKEKWRQMVWARYNKTQLLLFRSMEDYETWVGSSSISGERRIALVAIKLDFLEECSTTDVDGFFATEIKLKQYERLHLHQFKLDKWVTGGAIIGPSIVAAFASTDAHETISIRETILSCIRAIPGDNRGGEYQSYTLDPNAEEDN
eukprot:CAMPEP_0194303518 /NCGR_PEP_ID=MMETSP0171-20130528/1369_1 /TAXON_ID=218684 /ORGANISM="Corethron pennatum, Strain L29A3" /LENGTH=320 /DNA_ID=CAMNT_0039054443 /DNA_START=72 /DNA_END=1034 /DNA_ORIENTATION=-